MREIRWLVSFFLALLVHGLVLAGFFVWHPGFKRSIIYSPSFSVALYAGVPEKPRSSKPPQGKAKPLPSPSKPRPKPKPKSKPKLSPRPKKAEKQAWKVKEKKKRTTRKVQTARKKVKSKSSVSRKKRLSRAELAAREQALLARALAKVSKEVSMGGGGGVSRESVELRYKAYYDKIWRRVKASWILPEEVVNSGEDLLTVVVVRIGRDGSLLEMKLEESSGNKIYDQSCLRAVKKAAPFPPLPKDYPQKYMELGLRFRPWE